MIWFTFLQSSSLFSLDHFSAENSVDKTLCSEADYTEMYVLTPYFEVKLWEEPPSTLSQDVLKSHNSKNTIEGFFNCKNENPLVITWSLYYLECDMPDEL